MIIRAVKKLLGRARRIRPAEHGIKPSQIDSEAAAIAAKLQKNGYESYIVGGAVRDLLVGIAPKDFDISTKATPQQVRALFHRSRIIGRRFQIVHVPVRKRRAYIEVTTFRTDGAAVVRNESGRIVHDNIFGDAADDAVRRDFSCNALFYNTANGQILDYVGGYNDIKNRRLRVIGSSPTRFRQDPVRILRALRLEAKLSLSINATAQRAMADNAHLLHEISRMRLFEEVIKMLNSGCAAEIFKNCAARGVSPHFFPAIAKLTPLQKKFLHDADRRANRRISISFLIAAIFWREVEQEWRRLQRDGMAPYPAMERALKRANFSANNIIPRRIIARVYEFYALIARMEGRLSLGRASRMVREPLFRRACAFNTIIGGEAAASAKWWRAFAEAETEQRRALLEERRR